jgi:hypothetical protein
VWRYNGTAWHIYDTNVNIFLLSFLLHCRKTMPDTYTCTCAHFCKGYKTGLSRATYYRHAPYRSASAQSSTFSSSFQTFLDNSANVSGSGRDTNHASQAIRPVRTDESENSQVRHPLPQLLSSCKFISHVFSILVRIVPISQMIW